MRRYLYGISVRGASHIRKGTECQDSCRVESLSDSAAVIAAADGHGSDSCPFSSIGAKIAVEVFCSSMKEILGSFEGSSYMLRSYLSREGNMKIPESIETEWKRCVMLDHIRNGREPLVSEPDADGANGVYKLYGTTLLGLLITTEFVFAFQIGDGDIVMADRNGVQYAVESEKILGVETYSLSSANAWKKSTVSVFPSPGQDQLPYMYIMSTDGMANSHRTQKDFEKTCMDYYEIAVKYGFGMVSSGLAGWLSETSRLGCGDDITLVMAYFDTDNGKTANPGINKRKLRKRHKHGRHGGGKWKRRRARYYRR